MLKYSPCLLHQSQFLQIVCQQCQQFCLVCPVCIDQYHVGHSMISLKKFITEEVSKMYKGGKDKKPNKEKMQKGVEHVKHRFLQGFEQMRKSIGNQINIIQQVYMHEAQKLKRQIEVICGQGGYSLENIPAIKKKIKNKILLPEQQTIQKQFQDLSLRVELLLEQTTMKLCKDIQSLIEYWESSFNILLDSKQKTKHHFSDLSKHQLIEIHSKEINNESKKLKPITHNSLGDHKNDLLQPSDNTVAINATFDSKYHIAVIEPALNPIKNTIDLKIEESTNNCVWIGVCQLSKIKQKGFENCYKKGQGCYWIWQSGGQDECQFFSTLLQDSIILDHRISVKDIITIEIQYTKSQQPMNKLSFYKTSTSSQIVQKVLLYSGQIQKKQYHSCVGLGDQSQSVSII